MAKKYPPSLREGVSTEIGPMSEETRRALLDNPLFKPPEEAETEVVPGAENQEELLTLMEEGQARPSRKGETDQ